MTHNMLSIENQAKEERDMERATAADRLDIAIMQAEDAFWEAISKAFPEVKYGDVGPEWVMTREQDNRRAVTSWLEGNATRPTPGKKYRTKRVVERYPFFSLDEGEVGVVQDYEDTDDIYIKMERYLGDDAIQWKNCIVYHGVELIDFFHDFEEVPGQPDPKPAPEYQEGDLVIFDDGIAVPMRGEVVIAGAAHEDDYVVRITRGLNRVLAQRDPTFRDETVELDLTRADVKPANLITNEEFDLMVQKYWERSD